MFKRRSFKRGAQPDRFTAAVAAEVVASSAARQELLQSIAETMLAVFGAQAASIAVLDEFGGDLVFQAVAGQGSDTLPGSRFHRGQGVAGTVLDTGEIVAVDDLARDPRFAQDVANETGYVPDSSIVCPLKRGAQTLGVLTVLDRNIALRTKADERELLVALADQAARALEVSDGARRARALLDGEADDALARVARLAAALQDGSPQRKDAAQRLVAALDDLL